MFGRQISMLHYWNASAEVYLWCRSCQAKEAIGEVEGDDGMATDTTSGWVNNNRSDKIAANRHYKFCLCLLAQEFSSGKSRSLFESSGDSFDGLRGSLPRPGPGVLSVRPSVPWGQPPTPVGPTLG